MHDQALKNQDNELHRQHLTPGMILNVSMIAVIAALLEQVVHEGTHAFVAIFSGAQILWFNLFAVSWSGDVSSIDRILISGSAAIVNILCGIGGAVLLRHVIRRPAVLTRLFVMYFTAVSFLAGFGYLFFDPIIYQPLPSLADATGDWTTIIAYLGGGWLIRLAIFIPGAAGLFWTFVWFARSTMCFNTAGSTRTDRFRTGLPILVIPYFVICTVFTLLALMHPLGTAGLMIAVLKNWFGYSGFVIAFLFVVTWPEITPAIPEPLRLPKRISLAAVVALIVGICCSVLLVLPGSAGV